MQRTYTSGAREARVNAFVEGGTAIWVVRGRITAEMLAPIMVDAMAWHEETQADSRVSDYRQARVSAPFEDFLRTAACLIKRPRAIAGPMVIVPDPSQEMFFRKYAVAMNFSGVAREVCLDPALAIQWAARRASLRHPSVSAADPWPHGSSRAPTPAHPPAMYPVPAPAQ